MSESSPQITLRDAARDLGISIEEFTKFAYSEQVKEKAKERGFTPTYQTILKPDPGLTPWRLARKYRSRIITVPGDHGAIKELADRLELMRNGEGLRMILSDVPEGSPVDEQVAFLWKVRPDVVKKYQLVFVHPTSPIEAYPTAPFTAKPKKSMMYKREVKWITPRAITRSDPYPMAREILSRDVVSMWKLVPIG